jgi:CubicO group peptidase (beta-lactamase class C family)
MKYRLTLCCWLVAFSIAAASGSSGQTPAAATMGNQIDAVFGKYISGGTPGCVVSVVQNGSVLYARAYGMANLEWALPNTFDTVFDIGSVSKQFTAFAILLLAQDGRISLDNDIRKYLPELPNYGKVIRIHHLLNHTSGLRNYTDLFDLAGIPEIDLTTDQDALNLMVRQKKLNFAPGEEFLYSDTNFFFLSLIVERVTGKSLRQFARERMFDPLDMASTHFHNDTTMVVNHRATGYKPLGDGRFAIDMSNFEELGDGSVMTTVKDLKKWDDNFYTGRVGGMDLIHQMLEGGRLNNGTVNLYAKGLVVDQYRGLRRVQHAGEWVGYRAGLTRYPDQRTSFITLCNTIGDVFPTNLNQALADIVLQNVFRSGTAAPHSVSDTMESHNKPANDQASGFQGAYWDSLHGYFRHFQVRHGQLYREDQGDLFALETEGPGKFRDAESGTRFEFGFGNGVREVQERQEEGEHLTLIKVPGSPAGQDLSAFAGIYVSDELNARWTLIVRDGKLVRTQYLYPDQALRPAFADAFSGDLSEDTYLLHFQRDTGGHVTGFAVSTDMIRPTLTFTRVHSR